MSQSAIPFLAIGAATALTLTGYNAAQMSTYYAAQGQVQNLSDCSSFSLDSYGDPYVAGYVGATKGNRTLNDGGSSNLTTIDNTANGPTQIATTVESYGASGTTVNATVSITHGGSGANAWTLATTENGGIISAKLTDSNGTHAFTTNNNGTAFAEPDGTKIIVTKSPTDLSYYGKVDVIGIHVLQPLTAGGYIDTVVMSNSSYDSTEPGISVDTQGRGNAVINGDTVAQATGGAQEAAFPCLEPKPTTAPVSAAGGAASESSQARN